MTGIKLRQKYIEFFESKGCLHLPSDSLAPDDPSLLFTSAGMVQFKPYFAGTETPPKSRVVTAQKCLRTDDIEEVGDAVHHTFFEMMGNFSFGDYFKHEAILWAWEFLTEWLHLPQDRIWTSVYLDDDEAADIWINKVGLPADRLVRLGEDKNYWPANAPSKGPNGPCGPCNEIFLDMQPQLGRPDDAAKAIAYDSNRFVEIWNLVFMQYMRHEDATLTPLPKKNIDTGLGLERATAILQGVDSAYDTDLFRPLIHAMEQIAGVKYGSSEQITVALRTIADHTRGAVFCIADGVMPSNVKRGYVLRRMIRRAVLKAHQIGHEGVFLSKLAPTVAEMMGKAYPEITNRLDLIVKVLLSEEEKFAKTLAGGMVRLEDEINSIKTKKGNSLSGSAAFTLYDTYGFPVEWTEELLRAQGLTVDITEFNDLMENQRKRAKEGNKMFLDVFSGGEKSIAELQKVAGKTDFVGYDQIDSEATVKAILLDGSLVDAAEEGDTVQIVLDKTPFYAESGGQVGDFGEIKSASGLATVSDTRKTADIWLHEAAMVSGEIKVGDNVMASVYGERRASIKRNHTATHLLHSSLRKFLGAHVAQAGSLVSPERLRFDFSHFQAMTDDELRQVEDDVNKHILEDIEVQKREMNIQEALDKGAMALFGEKYGDVVRTVTISDVSMELCGGTHLNRTSEIGLFKIVTETSIASGVRRIEAVTGQKALDYVRNLEDKLHSIAERLSVPQSEILPAIDKLHRSIKEQQQALAVFKSRSSGEEIGHLLEQSVQMDGFKVICSKTDNTDTDAMSELADQLANKLGSAVVVLASDTGGKALFVTKVTSDLIRRGLHAGNLIKSVAQEAGGSGGGRPDFAKAGGKDASKLDQALSKALSLIREAIG